MTEELLAAERAMNREDVKVISFDLFDTLVSRPLFSNREHLRLFAAWLRAEYGLDIGEDRLTAPRRMRDPYAALSEIWRFFAAERGLAPGMAERLADAEFEFDLRHLRPSALGQRLYSLAAATGKRILLLSDMYYSSRQIGRILEAFGYQGISAIYVSCERRAVKRSGELYSVAAACEGLTSPGRMLHIGDHAAADRDGAALAGAAALLLPSDRVWFAEKWGLVDRTELRTAYESAVYGTALPWFAERNRGEDGPCGAADAFAGFVLFPLLLHAAMALHTRPEVQDPARYRFLDFVSRDGFLMKTAYDILAQRFPASLPSRYLHASRISCGILTEVSFWDRMASPWIPEGCTLRQFLTVTVREDGLRERLLRRLSPSALALSLKRESSACRAALAPYEEALSREFAGRKQAAFRYYRQRLDGCGRALLVDCGFRGTVAGLLTEGFRREIAFDKFFLWEKPANRENDRRFGTWTGVLFPEKRGHCLAPMVESFLSEPTGSCLGFGWDPGGAPAPYFEADWYPAEMRETVRRAQESALQLVRSFEERYGDMLPELPLSSLECWFSVYSRFLEKGAQAVFSGIRFRESYSPCLEERSLWRMIEEKRGKDDD